VARAFDPVHLALFCYCDIARRDLDGVALFVDLIFAVTGENRPSILAFRMRMRCNGLARLDMPGDDDCMFRLLDHGTNRFPVAYLHVVT